MLACRRDEPPGHAHLAEHAFFREQRAGAGEFGPRSAEDLSCELDLARWRLLNGGPEQVRNWSRLYMVPGAGHCGGGPSLDAFDALTAIVNWVEQGVAPASLPATGRTFPGRSRPLCSYPLHAHYKGTGNTEDAANFECRQ